MYDYQVPTAFRPLTLQVNNVQANTEGKLDPLLQQLYPAGEVVAVYRGGEKHHWVGGAPADERILAERVRSGRRPLVVPATPKALKHLMEYLRRHDIRNIVLTLDEADSMLATLITRAEAESDVPKKLRTHREARLFELLGRVPLGGSGVCRSVLWVSVAVVGGRGRGGILGSSKGAQPTLNMSDVYWFPLLSSCKKPPSAPHLAEPPTSNRILGCLPLLARSSDGRSQPHTWPQFGGTPVWSCPSELWWPTATRCA